MQPMLQQERQREITEKGRTVKNNMRKKYTTERRKESERRAEEEKTNKCKMRITTTIAIKIAKDAENTSTMNSKKKIMFVSEQKEPKTKRKKRRSNTTLKRKTHLARATYSICVLRSYTVQCVYEIETKQTTKEGH